MTKRTGLDGVQRKTANYEYTFVNNSYATEELGTRAKASSIGSTDKRSQISSDSVRKRDYLAITQPTMHKTGPNNNNNAALD